MLTVLLNIYFIKPLENNKLKSLSIKNCHSAGRRKKKIFVQDVIVNAPYRHQGELQFYNAGISKNG
jgi:hypothetical protein